METHQGFFLHNAKIISSDNPITKVKRKHKRHKGSLWEKNFYRLAATLAHPDLKEEIKSDENEHLFSCSEEFNSSWYLEPSYQEKSPMFFAEISQWQPAKAKHAIVNAVINKWRQATGGDEFVFQLPAADHGNKPFFEQPQKTVVKNGVSFSGAEISILLSMIYNEFSCTLTEYFDSDSLMPALDFHHTFFGHLTKEQQKPLVLWGVKNGINSKMACGRARLFWSHRMYLKSQQTNGGAEPLIRYFHAAFRLDEGLFDKVDILYWLRFDLEQRPCYGEFIEAINETFLPKKLISPRELIEHMCLENKSLIGLDAKKSVLLQEVLKMYLQSIAT